MSHSVCEKKSLANESLSSLSRSVQLDFNFSLCKELVKIAPKMPIFFNLNNISTSGLMHWSDLGFDPFLTQKVRSDIGDTEMIYWTDLFSSILWYSVIARSLCHVPTMSAALLQLFICEWKILSLFCPQHKQQLSICASLVHNDPLLRFTI